MILDSHDIRSVPFTVLAHGTYEPFQSHLLIELGKISESFLDIGANAGYYSLVLSQANPKIQICAIEPNPEVFKFLQYNLRLNNCSSRVTTYNLGLSSIDRESILFIPKFTGSGGGSLRPLHSEEGSHSQTTVEVKQLDNLDVRKADLIKMDTEGSEYNILLGGGKTLRDNLPTICCELLRKWMGQFGYSPQDFVNLLAQLHYRCFAIGKDCLREIVEINDRTEETNFIFCQSTNTKHLNVLLPYLKK
jgi:FkbM family methyltransferase